MEVCVWKYGREVRGWDGKQETLDKVLKFPVLDIKTALYSVYKTDAHFCPAIIYEYDAPVTIQPRLTKASVDQLAADNKAVYFKIIAIDVDAPGKDANTNWREAEKEKVNASPICSNAIIYDTAGGYRLVWELENKHSIGEYEKKLKRLRETLAKDNIIADPLVDWTRCYRLPKVTRGGIVQDLYLLIPPSFVLNENLLVGDSSKVHTFLDDIAEAKTTSLADIEEVATGGRNAYLFKMASKIRGTGWIPESAYLPMLIAINNEKCNPPLSEKEVQIICNSASKYPKGDEEEEEKEADKIKIPILSGELASAADDTILALATVLDNSIYHRDGKLIRLVDDKIEIIPKPALRKLLGDHIRYIKYSKDGEEVKIDPPTELVDMIYEMGTFPRLRELHELLLIPTLTPEGSIVREEGYNHELKAYIRPTVSIKDPPIGREHAEAALSRLMSMIDEFPFEKKEHLSVALAGIMTPVLRSAIQGPTPLFLIDSTIPGTGKSKLADIASLIATGKVAARMVQTKEEEMEKRITAILLSGARTCLIDNVEHAVGGASLDALMTGDYWTGRILSKSEMTTIKIKLSMFATGNNIVLKGDLIRRSLRCFMDPNTETPEERVFRIEDHKQYVEQNRAQIIEDILTIALSYQNEERVKAKNFGSFEEWARIVREPLMWLGLPDPVITQRELKEDSVATYWSAILEALSKIFGTGWFGVKDLYDAAFEGVRRNGEQEAYAALTANIGYFSEPNVKQLSWTLKKWLGRIVEGKKLIRGDKDRMKGYLFKIEIICQENIKSRQQAA